jgi:hypothetical protein
VDITAASGDQAYNFATVNNSLAQANPAGIAAYLQGALKTFSLTQAQLPTDLPLAFLPRGRTVFGFWKDEMRCFAFQNDCQFSIQDDVGQVTSMTSYVPPGPPIIVSPSTGLIGTPEQTQNGITLRTLMNPAIKVCSMIELQATVNLFEYSLDALQQGANSAAKIQNLLDVTNHYYVMYLEHAGDTRGTEWYSSMTCLSLDANLQDVNLTGYLNAGPVPTNSTGTSNRIDGPGP